MNGNKLLVMKRLRKMGGRILAVFFLSLIMMGMEAAATTHWVNDDDPNGGGYAPPGTSCLNPGYATIGAAVGPAVSGDTIMVCAGTYTENIVLNESLTLLGAQFG